MKTITVTILALVFASAAAGQDVGTIDPTVKGQIGTMLAKYYGVKDALTASDHEAASAHSGELVTALEAVDAAKMSEAQKTQWEKLRALIRTDAVHINRNKDLPHQRDHFIKLSNNMYALVANFKANDAEAYLHYCPMKKASWLSNSKEVKNPYYGAKMLKCGSVKATLAKN